MRRTVPARIRLLADLVPSCACAADIGCDHGLLGGSLLEEGTAERVIATDLSENSLRKAEWLRRRFGNRADLRQGDGLEVLEEGEAEVIVVAGMGGREIMRILHTGARIAAAAGSLVLMPHRNAPQLRIFLQDEGYEIQEERVAEEKGRFYPVLRCRPGTTRRPYDMAETAAGRFSFFLPGSPEDRMLAAEEQKLERRLRLPDICLSADSRAAAQHLLAELRCRRAEMHAKSS